VRRRESQILKSLLIRERSRPLNLSTHDIGVLQGVAVNLYEVRTGDGEKLPLLVAEIDFATAQSDREDLLPIAGKRERDLVFDPDRGPGKSARPAVIGRQARSGGRWVGLRLG
jgi:hypothetical protein